MMIRGGRRVLVISAHAADFCARAGGTIIKLLAAGSNVHVQAMSYGERCESDAAWKQDPQPTLEQVAALRRAEMQAAAQALGCTVDGFGWADSPLQFGPDRLRAVCNLLRKHRADLVISHWSNDLFHPDHLETAKAVLWASRYCNRPDIELEHGPIPLPEVLCFETTLGTGPVSGFVPNLYVDISAEWPRKLAALQTIVTQSYHAVAYEVVGRSRAQEARFSAFMPQCDYAEAFVRLGAEQGG